MATIKVGTEDVLKVYLGTDELSSLAIGGETIPITPTPPAPDYSTKPFTIEMLNGDTLSLKASSSALYRGLRYSVNDGERSGTLNFGGDVAGRRITNLSAGDKITFSPTEEYNGLADSSASYIIIGADTTNGNFNAYGNIMSLCHSDFLNASAMASYSFSHLFRNSLINDASNLVFPSFASSACYEYMFSVCSIITAPTSLPATTLADSCYFGMFSGSTGLTTAPNLPSTTLASWCYADMFQGCTSLTTAPELSASTLTANCYRRMFSGCTSVSAITCLATDKSASKCTKDWVGGVAANGTFVQASGVSWSTGVDGIPSGWTVETV